jgi:putative transposon-encoded protein
MVKATTQITIKDFVTHFERTATPIGNGAHIIVPREYVGMDFLLVVKGKAPARVFQKGKAKD